nr:S-layer homology domain-containing protein [Oscillospiraceae bacterium]
MKARKVLSAILGVALLLSLLPVFPASAAGYNDVSGKWAEKAINRWTEYGVVQGDRTGFRPNDTLTRAESAAIFTRLFGLTETAGATSFDDVAVDAWYADAFAKASAAGLLKGDGNGHANPKGVMT